MESFRRGGKGVGRGGFLGVRGERRRSFRFLIGRLLDEFGIGEE